jgi:HAD superfamily hydrolase (TIGR01509 family)
MEHRAGGDRSILGVIFDLDGTLVESGLDFAQMRREMCLPANAPLLEAIAELPAERAAACRQILDRHEEAGARRAALFPGVRQVLVELDACGIRRALLTRSSRRLVEPLLTRLRLRFDPVMTRDDDPIKPDPAVVRHICRQWNLPPHRVALVGDFHFDITCGRLAGARTVLFTAGRSREHLEPWAEEADLLLESFAEADGFFRWLSEPG